VSFVERALRVCLRKPDDFDLTGNCYFRVWDFNEALFGETLYAWHVVQLCFALEKMGKKEFKLLLSDHCGGKISVISPYVEAGKHSYAMEILVDKSKPRLYLNCTSGGWGGIYFNPQSYYAVIPKE
jgi:hypothetical protein